MVRSRRNSVPAATFSTAVVSLISTSAEI